jgi:hypothetical protein
MQFNAPASERFPTVNTNTCSLLDNLVTQATSGVARQGHLWLAKHAASSGHDQLSLDAHHKHNQQQLPEPDQSEKSTAQSTTYNKTSKQSPTGGTTS